MNNDNQWGGPFNLPHKILGELMTVEQTVDEALGKVLYVLGGIQSRLDSLERNFIDERAGANQHRSDLRVIIAALTQSNMDLASKYASINDRLDKLEPYVDKWRERISEERGAGKVVMLFRTLVIALAGAVSAIVTYLGLGFPTRPH